MFPFELFGTLFWVFFILTFIVIIFVMIVSIVRAIKAGKFEEKEKAPIIKEREIIREIVKIRCSYCGNLYDEKLDRCPYCGAKNG